MAETIPFDPDDINKQPLDAYGKDKFESELYLKDEYRKFKISTEVKDDLSASNFTRTKVVPRIIRP